MIPSFLKSDVGLQLAMLAASAAFAVALRWLSHDHDSKTFTVFLLQGVTLVASLVVTAALFYPPLFDQIENQKSITLVIVLMTIIYSVRDISETFGQSKRRGTAARPKEE